MENLHNKVRCVIVCASPDCDDRYLNEVINKESDYIICADGGMEHLRNAGLAPDIWIGDFDSWQGEVKSDKAQIIRLNPEKDDTDTISCVNKAVELGFKKIVLLCALGGRIDHTFANLSVLLYGLEQDLDISILTPAEEIRVLNEGKYFFENQNGKTFSVFAFGCDSAVISYEGAKYPLDRYNMKAFYPIGISNIFVRDRSKIIVHSGKVLCIINLRKISYSCNSDIKKLLFDFKK